MKEEINIKYVVEEYAKNRSTYDIAAELNTYPNKIKRILVQEGVKIRTRGEAQSLALAQGRHTHPTKGKKRTKETKEKIGESLSVHWKTMTPEERNNRVEQSRTHWNNMSDVEKEQLRSSAARAVRAAAQNGSKTEQFLMLALQNAGFRVEFHKENIVSNEKLQLDLFLPEMGVAIEIDGPAHFFPIWGEENLQKHIKADAAKNALLIDAGYTVIRVKHLVKSISTSYKRKVAKQIIELLNRIQNKELTERFIEIEVD